MVLLLIIQQKRQEKPHNLYCENREGIWIHKYGPHVFRTDNKKVWDFVNNMTHFNPYIQQTVAKVEDKLYTLPFNMWTFYQLWGITTPEEAEAKIDSQKYTGEIHNLEEKAKSLVGNDIYKKLIKSYNEKQWGRDCSNLPSFIIKRLPTRLTFNGNYFNDRYQGIPEGCYNSMIEKMLRNTKMALIIIKIEINIQIMLIKQFIPEKLMNILDINLENLNIIL